MPAQSETVTTADVSKSCAPVEAKSMSLVSLISSGAKRKAESQESLNTEQSGKPAKKPRRRWKKPKGKPKRPLSAYNLYFKAERERMLRRKECANLGFRDMAKIIAVKWNDLPSEDREIYEGPAKEERTKYFNELAEWKKKQQAKQAEEKFDEQMENLYSSLSSSSEPVQENDDPLPVAVTSSCTPSAPLEAEIRQNDFLATTLQMASDLSNDTLKLVQEDKPQDIYDIDNSDSLFTVSLDDPLDSVSSVDSSMNRILKSCDILSSSIDDEFCDFMSALDWNSVPIDTVGY